MNDYQCVKLADQILKLAEMQYKKGVLAGKGVTKIQEGEAVYLVEPDVIFTEGMDSLKLVLERQHKITSRESNMSLYHLEYSEQTGLWHHETARRPYAGPPETGTFDTVAENVPNFACNDFCDIMQHKYPVLRKAKMNLDKKVKMPSLETIIDEWERYSY
jgi:hypothetical protein